MKLHHDYSESSGFEALPPGEYAVVIEKCVTRTSGTGNRMYAITLGVQGSRRKLFDNIFVDEQFLAEHEFASNKIVSLLRSCGFPCGAKAGEEFSIPVPDMFLAKIVYAQITVDKKDSTKNNVFHYYGQPYEQRPKKTKQGFVKRAIHQQPEIKNAAPENDQVRKDFENDGNPF